MHRKILDDNSYKEIRYNEDNQPSWYSEGTIEEGEEKEKIWLDFDDNGTVIYGREYDN